MRGKARPPWPHAALAVRPVLAERCVFINIAKGVWWKCPLDILAPCQDYTRPSGFFKGQVIKGCGAKPGEPCKGKMGHKASVCLARNKVYQTNKEKWILKAKVNILW